MRILCLAKANDEPWAFGLPGRLMTGFLKFPWVLHPRKRTWNLKLSHLEKETHLKKTSIFGFHFGFWKEASFQDTGTWFDKKHTKNLLKNMKDILQLEKFAGHMWEHNFVVVSPSGKLMTLQKSWYEKTLQSSDFPPLKATLETILKDVTKTIHQRRRHPWAHHQTSPSFWTFAASISHGLALWFQGPKNPSHWWKKSG